MTSVEKVLPPIWVRTVLVTASVTGTMLVENVEVTFFVDAAVLVPVVVVSDVFVAVVWVVVDDGV